MTPFPLRTIDNETLYAWHILPLPAYLRNEEKLLMEPGGYRDDFTKTESFNILKNDPEARLVIYCKSLLHRHSTRLTLCLTLS